MWSSHRRPPRPNRQLAALRRCRIEQVQVSRLLVDDLPTSSRCRVDGEVGVPGERADLFRFRVVGVDVELTVPVGPEVERIANPHRVHVVGAPHRLRHLLHLVCAGGVHPDLRHATATISLPLSKGAIDRVVRDPLRVRREGRLKCGWNRQLYLDAACEQNIILYAPFSDIVLTQQSTYCGALSGETIHLASNAQLWTRGDYDLTLQPTLTYYQSDNFVECRAESATAPNFTAGC